MAIERSADGERLHDRNAVSVAVRMASTSETECGVKDRMTRPVAGLTDCIMVVLVLLDFQRDGRDVYDGHRFAVA